MTSHQPMPLKKHLPPTPPVARARHDEIDPTLPETVRRYLLSGAQLEPIRLDRHGHWWHRGEPFENRRLIDLFSRSVERTDGGTWVLHIAPFTYPIEVEDTGYFVQRITMDLAGGILRGVVLHLSDGTDERLDPSTLQYDDSLRCRIKDGQFEARFLRMPYYQLVDHVEADRLGFKLMLGERAWRIPPQGDV